MWPGGRGVKAMYTGLKIWDLNVIGCPQGNRLSKISGSIH